jgi:hypothetical protein
MRVCQFRHYGTMNTMKGSAKRRDDLTGHAFLFRLQVDCNTRVWIVELTAMEDLGPQFPLRQRVSYAVSDRCSEGVNGEARRRKRRGLEAPL